VYRGPFVSVFGYAEPLLRVVRYLTMTRNVRTVRYFVILRYRRTLSK
jgi:hypothetical protein